MASPKQQTRRFQGNLLRMIPLIYAEVLLGISQDVDSQVGEILPKPEEKRRVMKDK